MPPSRRTSPTTSKRRRAPVNSAAAAAARWKSTPARIATASPPSALSRLWRPARGEGAERLVQPRLGAVVVEVVRLDVGDERDARLVLQERLRVLVGLDD